MEKTEKLKISFIRIVCRHLNGERFITIIYITDKMEKYEKKVTFDPQQEDGDSLYQG